MMDAWRQDSSVVRRLRAIRLPLIGSSFAAQLTAIFVLSVVVQLLVGWFMLFRPEVPSLDMDEQEYWTLAGQVLSGLPMEVGRRTVAFPLIIAGLRAIWDNLLFVQSAVAVLAATAAPLLALVVRKLTQSQAAAGIAGVGFALWPAQIFYASSLYSETLALPMFLLLLLLLPFDAERDARTNWLAWAAAGAVLGLTSHVRPMYQLFLPVLAIALLLDTRRVIAATSRFALVLAGFAVVVLPWSVYVTEKLGHPVLLTANGGETFAGGFTPKLMNAGERELKVGNRTTWYGPGKWVPVSDNGYLSPQEQSLPYAQQDQLMRQRAMNWVKAKPGDAAYLAWRKVSYMWGVYPFALNGFAQALFGNTLTLVLLILFAVALADNGMVRRNCARLYLLPLFVTGVGLISWGSWRFRLPADAGMIAVVAIWLSARIDAFIQRLPPELETKLA